MSLLRLTEGARRIIRRVCIAGLVAIPWLVACADFDGVLDPTFGLLDVVVASPTLSHDVQPILDRRCAFGGCHSAATRQAGLSLVAGASHAALVGRPSRLSPGDTIVIAGAASRSWLVRILSDDPALRAGVSRMPLAAPALTDNQRATIARWIDRGAPPD